MQLKDKLNANLLVLIAASVIVMTGCQASAFKKPDLAKLAFWKKDGDALAAKTVPPPPARHFDPAPLNRERTEKSEVVDLDRGNLERRFDNNIEQALDDIKSASTEPIRTPYSADIKPTGNEFAPSGIAAKSGNASSKLSDLSGGAASELSFAQQQFQSAMESTRSATDEGIAAAKQSSNDFTTGWKNDIKLPTGLASTSNNVDQSLASVNQSLSNANQAMADSASKFSGAITSKADDFHNRVQQKIDSATQSANDFASDARSSLASAAQPFNALAPNNSNNFTPFGSSPQQGSPNTLQDQGDRGDLDSVQAQVADAKQQIENLKMQIEDAKRKSNSFPPYGQSNPSALSPAPARIAQQMPMPKFDSAYASPGSFGAPANMLRSDEQSVSAQPNQPLTPQKQNERLTPTYPATPHGGFVPKGVSMNSDFVAPPLQKAANTQAGFNSYSNQSNVVTAGSRPQSSDSASKIQNFVTDVDIPDSILKGSGSYAPGSVNPLKK